MSIIHSPKRFISKLWLCVAVVFMVIFCIFTIFFILLVFQLLMFTKSQLSQMQNSEEIPNINREDENFDDENVIIDPKNIPTVVVHITATIPPTNEVNEPTTIGASINLTMDKISHQTYTKSTSKSIKKYTNSEELDDLLKEVYEPNFKPIKPLESYNINQYNRSIFIPIRYRCELLEKILDSIVKQPQLKYYDLYISLDDIVRKCVLDLILSDRFCPFIHGIVYHPRLYSFILPNITTTINKNNISYNFMNEIRSLNNELIDYKLICKENNKSEIIPPLSKDYVSEEIVKIDYKKISKYSVIEKHIKFILDYSFLYYNYEYTIVLEDDLLPSSDFLNVFYQLEHFLYQDPTVFCISAWNDNGRKGQVSSLTRFYRTNYLPGLGWMTNKEKWLELTYEWHSSISSGWDHYIRAQMKMKKIDCIFPEVPRVKHMKYGVKGTTVNRRMQKLLDSYEFSNAKPDITYGELDYLYNENYFDFFSSLFNNLKIITKEEIETSNNGIILYVGREFRKLSRKLGIYTTPRGTYQYSIIIPGTVKDLFKPKGNEHGPYIITNKIMSPFLPVEMKMLPSKGSTIIVADNDEACTAACELKKLSCVKEYLQLLNSFHVMKRYFPCNATGFEVSKDMPNFVISGRNNLGMCLITEDLAFNCNGHNAKTQRLCICTKI